jgi:RHS repeat-associated protein
LQFERADSEYIQATNLSHRYLWGAAVDQILADEVVDNGGDEDVLWTLGDHLNTVRDLAVYTSGQTTVATHRVFDAFGKETPSTPAGLDSIMGFTGKPLDHDTGLQNNINRWYEAGTGKWLSEDPIGFKARDVNLYRYVGNGPMNATDPSGQSGVLSDNKIETGELDTMVDNVMASPNCSCGIKITASGHSKDSTNTIINQPGVIYPSNAKDLIKALQREIAKNNKTCKGKACISVLELTAHSDGGKEVGNFLNRNNASSLAMQLSPMMCGSCLIILNSCNIGNGSPNISLELASVTGCTVLAAGGYARTGSRLLSPGCQIDTINKDFQTYHQKNPKLKGTCPDSCNKWYKTEVPM